MKNLLLITALITFVSGCMSPQPVSTGAVHRAAGYDDELITKSLFDSKDRTISEEDIQRLLNGRIKLPDTVRVALFKFSGNSINRYYTNYWTDEEYLKTQQSFVDTLISQVSSSSRVKKVIPVPAMMTTSNPNLTQLRETAVRLQADVLIVYSISSDIYYKYKMFKQSEAKAFATCEAILMDTRTGVIPHSSVVTREKLVYKQKDELSESETRKKAEKEAVLLSLMETGKHVSEFLDQK
jgi:hypothetical protein